MLFCFLRLYWVFIKSVFAVGSEAVAVGDTLIFKNIAFFRNCLLCLSLGVFYRDCVDCLLWLFLWLVLRLIDRWFFMFVCYVLFWTYYWLSGCVDCLIWLIVPVGCFLLNGCDFVRKKKNYGLTVHCNAAVVKPYVKMSAFWSMRLIFWFGRVLFVVKTFSCSERRFANDEKVKSFAK